MKLRLIDFVTPKRWRAVTAWILKKILMKLDESDTYLELHEIEQLMFRILMCPECAKADECIHCGCNFTGRINNWFDSCSQGKWGSFFNKEEWEKHKEEYGLKFFMAAKYTSQEDLRKIKNFINNYLA